MRTIVIASAYEKSKVASQAIASVNLLFFPADAMFISFAAPDIRAL